MATTSPVGIYYRTQAEARPTDEAMALSLANSIDRAVGFVPVIPSSIFTASGTASVDATGAVTFTTTTSISLNGVFTSAYENYRIIIGGNWLSNVSATGTGLRYRANGTDNTSSLYYGNGVYQNGTGVPSSSQWTGGNNYHYLATLHTDGYGFGIVDVFSPAQPVRTLASDVYQGITANVGVYGAHTTLHDVKVSYDGFTIITTSANNMTGRVKVYGYR